jgi:hydroxymethylbilane synthase
MSAVRIATRGSDLALTQARYIASRIETEIGAETELVIIQTTGDRIQNVSLAKIGGKGLFVKEIEEALLEERADVAVHSAKDLPARFPAELELVAFPQREDPRDALVARDASVRVDVLREGARVGTGSTRRTAQLLALRPDLEVVPLRGNVPTRIGKLESEGLDAVVLACAGLDRLGRSADIVERISTDVLLPAVCQGTLALESRCGDPLAEKLAGLDDPNVRVVATAERAFLVGLDGDCTVPMAVYAEWQESGRLRVRGLLASADGAQVIRCEATGSAEQAAELGAELADRVLAQGGAGILDALRESER